AVSAAGRPGGLGWAPGAGAAALGAEARRELRRETGRGRGRDAGREGRRPPSPNAAARPGAPPRPRTHPRAHARAWHTPAAGTRGLPRAPSAGPTGSGRLAQSRAHTHLPRTHTPGGVRASSPRSQASSARLGRRMQHLLKEYFTILHRNDSKELQPPGSPPPLPKPSSIVSEDVQTDQDCSLA
ncbi:hypothetical protein MC885_005046, partial [Smutsia gigantea]